MMNPCIASMNEFEFGTCAVFPENFKSKQTLKMTMLTCVAVLDVSFGPDTPRNRNDDKQLTSDEADAAISNLTEEQKQRLQEVLKAKGVSPPEEDAT